MKFRSLAALACAAYLPTLALADDITVTTTKDVVSADGECSLREAVAFVTANAKAQDAKDVATDTSHDCYPKGGSPNSRIMLNADKTFELTKEIEIGASMTIEADNVFSIRDDNASKQPTIINKTGRIFVIDDKSAFDLKTRVTLKGLALSGMQADSTSKPATSPVTSGGLIFNRERLALEQLKLNGGVANQGGAVYSASADASLSVSKSELTHNYADQGAGIYSETPNVLVENTVFANNGQLNTTVQGFVLYTQEATKPTIIPCVSSDKCDSKPKDSDFYRFAAKVVANTIFFDNRSGALVLKPSMAANNITVVNNDRGILFDNVFNVENKQNRQVIAAQLSNSIALGNGAYDIKTSAADMSFINHLLADRLIGVDIGNSKKAEQVLDIDLTEAQREGLLASETEVVDGKEQEVCRKPTVGETTGLFCPLVRLEKEYTSSLRPRLLMSYTTLGKYALADTPASESPIVNKAAGLLTVSNNARSVACEPKDIRNEKRDLCDLGAFELKIVKDAASSVGANATIAYGEIAYPDLKDSLGDGQLVPAAYCADYYQNNGLSDRIPNDANQWPSGTVGKWSDGCLLYDADKYPKKGKLTVGSVDGKLQYVPDSNWHGFDKFAYRVVTTTSRFSDSPNSKVIKAQSTILQQPPNGINNDTLNLGYEDTGSGGVGLFSLLGLMLLGGGTLAARRCKF